MPINKVAKELTKAMKSADKKETTPYDTSALVKRIEGGTAWVQIPGGVDETPVQLTMSAKEGDTVQVRVSGGRAWLQGNASAPPTDNTVANIAVDRAAAAQVDANNAREAAESAQEAAVTAWNYADSANTAANNALASAQNANEYASRSLASLSTVQSVAETLTWITQHGTMTLTTDTQLDPTHVYFVLDPTGDYVVNNTHYSLVTEPNADDLSTYYELSIDESLNNYVGTHLALTGEGLWLLPATSGTNKVLIATGGGTTYTTAGTYIINSTGGIEASFRSNGATIGQVLNGYSRTEIGTDGMQIIQRANGSDIQIANLGYGLGASPTGPETAPYYSLGTRLGSIGNYSVAEGHNVTASGFASHAEGYSTKATGHQGHAEGGVGILNGTTYYTTASGSQSHAEGVGTLASGTPSHAEGGYTIASGAYAHAEGHQTNAIGNYSHSSGYKTISKGLSQTVIGELNKSDDASTAPSSKGDYVFIIGNGSSESVRSNALTVDWNGNIRSKGDIYLGCNSDSTGGTKLSSAIGTIRSANASAKSVATATDTNLCSLSLEAGTWIITAGVRFPANANGHRRMNVSTTNASNAADVQLPAVSGASTQLNYTLIVKPTSTTTYYLNCYHNAGTTLNLIAGGGENGINFIKAVRIL